MLLWQICAKSSIEPFHQFLSLSLSEFLHHSLFIFSLSLLSHFGSQTAAIVHRWDFLRYRWFALWLPSSSSFGRQSYFNGRKLKLKSMNFVIRRCCSLLLLVAVFAVLPFVHLSMCSKSIYWIKFDFMNWSLFVVFCNQQVN
jgi:hypothetical protein